MTDATPAGGSGRPLPRGDVLLVTWTVDEGHALSRVLTPGKDSHNDYLPDPSDRDPVYSRHGAAAGSRPAIGQEPLR